MGHLHRDSRMILYHKLAMEMVDKFEVINFKHLHRVENQMANALATLAAMFQIKSNDEVQLIRMSIKEEPTHCLHIEEEIDGKLWYTISYNMSRIDNTRTMLLKMTREY